ncbi:fasciclin domain-containing protein [Deinococcus sp. YIM 134068]|uniref:fasciclin domain-containing protein n=1 Tax=Deinococcus lichenicola TaxID=3118910 RepID=UPI002F93078B
MQNDTTPAPKVQRPVLPVMAGLLAALSLAACAPATTVTATTSTTTPANTAASAPASSTAPGSGTSASVATSTRNNTSLATLIASDDRFTTLNTLVQQAGLGQALSSGTYTVFAPTNDAFLKLPPGVLTELSSNRQRLSQILLYHVVQGRVDGTALASANQLMTLQSGMLTLTRTGTRTSIGNNMGTAIIESGSSIDTGNGTLYVIESVLMPGMR